MKRYDIRFSLSEGEHAGETEDGEWVKWKDVKEVLENLKILFDTLDKEETTDEGRKFKPNYISSCRALDTAVLNTCLDNLKKAITNEN